MESSSNCQSLSIMAVRARDWSRLGFVRLHCGRTRTIFQTPIWDGRGPLLGPPEWLWREGTQPLATQRTCHRGAEQQVTAKEGASVSIEQQLVVDTKKKGLIKLDITKKGGGGKGGGKGGYV